MTTNNETGHADHVTYRLETSRDLLDRLGGELTHRARIGRESRGEHEGGPAGPAAEGPAVRRFDRVAVQLSRVCELVNLALTQVDLHDDLGMAWILLEQARQQLGHAAASAGMLEQRGDVGDVGDRGIEAEAGAIAHLVWFLQRDRMPWPDNASELVDFGGGPNQLPDFRPDTPLQLVPLQLLANSAMTFGAGDAVQDRGDRAMAMAFGEYVWTIMTEAMELLEIWADQADQPHLAAMADEGRQVADLVAGAFPPVWQVFQGPAGFPQGAD